MTARHARALLTLLLIAASSGCAAIDRLSGEGEARRIRQVGHAAEARVIAIEDTGMTLNDDPIVAFHLEVRPAAGPAYEVRTRGRVGRLDVPRIQPGAIVPVSVDPADPRKVAIGLYRER